MTAGRLAELLKPCPEEDFLDHSYGRCYRYIPGWGGKVSDLVSWADVRQIIDTHPRDWVNPETHGGVTRNRLSLMLRGQAIAPASFFREVPGPRSGTVSRLDPAKLDDLISRGASLVMDGVDEVHRPIGALATSLERALHDPVRVNLYASWRPTPALDRHWDTHDIFIVQVSGTKRWQVYSPVRRHPVPDDIQLDTRPASEPAWQGALKEGDVLYLPRGWWHVATALEGPSLHLTFGVYRRTGLDLLEWLGALLRESEAFREDLPRFAPEEERGAHLDRLRDELLARWGPRLLDRYLEDADVDAISRRPIVSIPWTATDEVLPRDREAVVQLTAPRPPVVEPQPDGWFELGTTGQRRRLTTDELEAVRPLLDLEPWSVSELCRRAANGIGADGARAMLIDLVRTGLLAVVDVEPRGDA
jgi:Cupin superfamily protein